MPLRSHMLVMASTLVITACGMGDGANATVAAMASTPSTAGTPYTGEPPQLNCVQPPCIEDIAVPGSDVHAALANKWWIVQVRVGGEDQTVDAAAGEGPYLWLKPDGSAELRFMQGTQTGAWATDSQGRTLTLVDADATTHFAAQRRDDGRMSLRSIHATGEFDVESMLLARDAAP